MLDAEPLTVADFEPGMSVVYRAPHVPANEPGEEGVVTSTSDFYVFVRFRVVGDGVACDADRLTPITPKEQS